ncbi:hypothetical protein QVD17_04533 [Tagetes erecta]|uniref:Late embryogenesis abundant protein LEA-2 subgroup domain-containing protein n=1 Tax=Tagetes erecta TaxID=13708 RepID=A0AAD8P9U9_TARER|nr:hypothetical protein QVD17_04533 [Tagetes erecta]
MATCSDFGTIIACLCFVSFFLGLNVLMPVMLSLYSSPSWPSFSIDLFDNQAINMTRFNENLTIHFHLKLKNENSAIGLHYPDPINITFSYFPNVSMMVNLADYTIHSFYQGNGKTKHVRDLVETIRVPTVLEGTDMVAFRVDLVATFKYKKPSSKRHKVVVGCDVAVNYTTSQKMQTGFIGMTYPGYDSQLQPPVDDDYAG